MIGYWDIVWAGTAIASVPLALLAAGYCYGTALSIKDKYINKEASDNE